MMIDTDWHIHTRNSCDEAALAVSDLVPEAEGRGITDFGLADHVHTPYNWPDIDSSRREFDACRPSCRFHFGVEVSCVSRWELKQVALGLCERPVYGVRAGGPPGAELAIGIDEAIVVRCGIEFVVGGTHWPMYVAWERDAVIRDFHRQNMFLVTHRLVDVVAHPWWWHGYWQSDSGEYRDEPWLGDFGRVPASMHDEFAAAAVAGDKKVEINLGGLLLNRLYPAGFHRQYLDYLAGLKERGVRLCVGSDCHSPHYEVDFEQAGATLERVGIGPEDLWRLPPRPPPCGEAGE